MPSLPIASLYTEKSNNDPPCIVDPTKLKYLAVTVMTAASTVLAKSVHFLEHVSPGCCAGIASIVPVSWSA